MLLRIMRGDQADTGGKRRKSAYTRGTAISKSSQHPFSCAIPAIHVWIVIRIGRFLGRPKLLLLCYSQAMENCPNFFL